MNEIWLYLNMLPSITVQKNWIKESRYKTQGQENSRATVILTILAFGEKLAPWFICKAQEVKHTENDYNK